MKNVLRLVQGDKIAVFDGQGTEAVGQIEKIANTEVNVFLERIEQRSRKMSTIILACAIPKKAKFETIIEKTTELGVDEIIPLETKRTQVIIPKNKSAKKLSRFQTIAVNAAKQSKRTTLPCIHPAMNFSDALKMVKNVDIAFIPCLIGERTSIRKVFDTIESTPKKIMFFIGPEGDFTPQEVKAAVCAGCKPITLGQTVLKVDTAAITVIALISSIIEHEK